MNFYKAKLIVLFALNSIYFSVFSQTSETYTWGNLPLGGGGFVSAVIAHPKTQNVIYARTDVGGAYRWVNASKTWVPLNDWSSIDELGLLGIESIALDPNNPAKVYMLAGTSYFNNGKTAILISNDYGATFTVVDVSTQFKAHGNGMGRQTGEKLAVDPKNSNIVFCGTRRDGLFKSTNGGTTWSKVSSFPLTTSPNDNGITFVQFDTTLVTGGVTQRMYIGFSRMGASNLYVSTDAGNSWTAVSGQPTNFIPQRVARASNGTLYITYANGVGPHGHWDPVSETMDQGAVWRYVPTSNVWTNITPSVASAYAGITVDPTNSNRVIVSTINKYLQQPWGWGDRIFVSTNGGSAWTDLIGSNKVTMSNNGIPWIDGHAIHWAGCLTIDPFNTERVFVTSGNGIFMTENISASISTWSFMAKGIEETVPLDIVSSVDAPVVTVIGDYDGSVYADHTTFPTLHSPQIGTSTGIDIAADNSLMIRVGGTSDGSNFPIYYSTNKGSTWTAFATKPNNATLYKGKAAVSANGATVLWGPENSSTIYKTTNRGGAWTAVSGITLTNAYPVADGVNANKFYIANGNRIYVSTNAGTSFTAAGTTATTDLKKIRSVPGVEGDIWAPTGGNGLYRSTNSGTSFTKITSVTECSAVGFGKAASGKTFPTVYIWGKVGTTVGIFRSIDAGATWVRINDDAHEYGGTANGQFVIGDMNTYGTVYMSTAGRGTIVGTPQGGMGCSQPNTGADITICGTTFPIPLQSNTTTATNVSYKWYKNNVQIIGATSPTYTISSAAGAAATYKVVRDSASCSKSDEIILSATLPLIELGNDIELCAQTTAVLDAGITGSVYTYSWSKNGTTITGATTKTYTATQAGTYSVTVSATNCSPATDAVSITSKLLQYTADTLCATGGVAQLEITSTGGPFQWYSTPTNGTLLQTSNTYNPSITNTTTYYVQDAGGVTSTIGKITRDATSTNGWYTNTFTDLSSKSIVTVLQTLTLESVSVDLQAQGNVSIRLLQGTTVVHTYTATNVAAGMQAIPVNFTIVPGTYTIEAVGTTVSLYLQTDMATYPYSLANYISFSNAEGWATTWYSLFYNWKIKVGNTCARTPIQAVVNPALPCTDSQSPTTPGTISFSTVTQNSLTATWTASTDNVGVVGYEVLLNGTLYSTVATNSISINGLQCNTSYTVRVRAKDAAGNFSSYNSIASTTTTNVAAPTITNTTPTLCTGATILLSIPTTTGALYTWTGPNSYTATTPTINRTNATTSMEGTYTATLTVNGCTSTASTTIVTVNEIPEAPIVTSPIIYQQNVTATALTASGTGLQWYTTETGGTGNTSAPTPSTTTLGATTYYVSQSISGCESPRAAIQVIIEQAIINQSIPLSQGWNLLSINVHPTDSSFSSVFNGLQVQTVKNAHGFWKPNIATQFNSIQKIIPGEGYLVYMNTAATLQISGTPSTGESFSVPMGWKLIGCPYQTASPFSTYFNTTNCTIIKNFEGFWEPNGSSNSIFELIPGKAYYIK